MRTAIDAWMEVRLEDGTLRASDTGGFQDHEPWPTDPARVREPV